ncbi:MAG: RNA 3'-terminal phosphate cyclase [Betaproteobacteria bacterium]|nr:MAG: RNA 3'-terminal phosphate cyclase [Betaproteobacteria bacterium]
MIHLNGATGEGGGQILRTALALSMCTGQPFRIEQIRAKRSKPGLMRQHLMCVKAAQQISGAEVSGATIGSLALEFSPGAVTAGDYRFAIDGAGSTMLVLQTVLPPLLLSSATSQITLVGGTHNPMAPPFQFIERAFARMVNAGSPPPGGEGLGERESALQANVIRSHTPSPQPFRGSRLSLALNRHGFFPAGGGEIVATITPQPLQPFHLHERGELRAAYAEVIVAGVASSVAERELATLGKLMSWSGEQLRRVAARQNEGPGNALIATLEFDNVTEVFMQLGEQGVSAESVAKRLARDIRDYQTRSEPVGPHLADQLLLLMALAGGGSFATTELTEHTRTNALVIEKFLPIEIAIEPRGVGAVIRLE